MKKENAKKIIILSACIVVVIILFILYIFKFRTCTITFETKLGAGVKTQEVKIGQMVKKPEDPTFENYKFIGWFLDGKEYDFDTPVKKSITIEAKWEKVNK